MSRIGRKPIPVPPGVEVVINGSAVKVKGPKGELSRVLPDEITMSLADGQIDVTRPSDEGRHRALHGLTRTLVANMVEGVTKGFEKSLEISGVGYRASKQGTKLVLQVGYSHPVEINPPAGIEIDVPAPTKITVRGIDKEAVGAMAAEIRRVREPEPYLGKGIKYANERIRRKAGKAGKVTK
ncbi:MAG TPA: 50S ribosomal protein L6 [Firmicutes bacterium]|nr:50S ribosomal protein L6 [Bacillota bacterium]